MPADKYEILALVARYWFTFLGVVIVWRSFVWLRKDARLKRKRLKQLPDAGLVGELVVLAGNETLPPGTVIPLPREGTLGSLRSCDISVPCSGVASLHGDFRFVNGVGLILTPAPRQSFMVDGEEPGPAQREWVLHHGSRLMVGDALLRMRLFMGLETARSAAFWQDGPDLNGLPEMAMEPPQEDEAYPGGPGYTVPVVMEEDFDPGWEEDTRPHRQQLLSWQDTGRYAYNGQYQMPEPQEAAEDAMEDWPYPYEEQPVPDWREQPAPPPPARRGLLHRRRR